MKKLRFYHIDYSRSTNDVHWEYQNMTENDRIALVNLKFDASFDYEDRLGNYNMYLLTTTMQYEKFKEILDNNIILYVSRDLSHQLLYNRFDLNHLKKNLELEQRKLYELFIDRLDEWLLENLEIDIVLDIINDKGIKKLRKIDKKFLENYGKI